MKIKKTAFGDRNEAFVEGRFSDGVNVIYSNDNNKGKTLVIQGLLYALGNNPIFPAGFDKRKYFFYALVEINGDEYEFLRKNETIILKHGKDWQSFDSLSELKYYIDKHLFTLPRIEKKGEGKIVDLELFYQLFAVGQDKRNTSTIQNAGYYTKTDFLSMLKVMAGCQGSVAEGHDVEQIKREIKEKQADARLVRRKIKLLTENPKIASQAFKQSDREDAEKHRKDLNEVNSRISELKRKRSREINRRGKLGNLLSELSSLNQTVDMGKIVCATCGSETIVYSNGDLSFEVSNNHVRKKVITSLREQISLKGDIIDELSNRVSAEQDVLRRTLRETPPELKNVLIFSEEIVSEEQYSSDLLRIETAIQNLKDDLDAIERDDDQAKSRYQSMMEMIQNEMNRLYRSVDSDGILSFHGLFSKHGENYSGSEEQEFYFCKLIALNSYFEHQFPIIMDSFRSGELSTQKEQIMIEYYKKIGKQVILTSTLKSEEYEKLKYDGISGINAIDYSEHQSSQILQPAYSDEFRAILDEFGVAIGD
jgi:predicted nuclease with TOPRIM domain